MDWTLSMVPLIEELRTIFREEFAGSTDQLSPRYFNSVRGALIWQGFDGVSDLKRLNRISAVLDRRLEPHVRQAISEILPLTPAEWTALQDQSWRQQYLPSARPTPDVELTDPLFPFAVVGTAEQPASREYAAGDEPTVLQTDAGELV